VLLNEFITPLLHYSITPVCSRLDHLSGCVTRSEIKIWEELSGEKSSRARSATGRFRSTPIWTEAIEKSRHYIEDQLRRSDGGKTQAFTDDTPRGKVQFVNLIAQFPTKETRRPLFLLCSHYDTKTFDTIKFVGANDAGSSTGLLLELARVMAASKSGGKIELVFFDGEEAYDHFFSETDGLYGSRYFARQLQGSSAQTIPRRDLVRHGWAIVPSTSRFLQIRSRNSARHLCGSGNAQAAKLFYVSRPRDDR